MFLAKWDLPFNLFIFWSWDYEDELLELLEKSKNIHFLWWKTLPEIQRYVNNCDYCLMPSTFLETFWLTALTAISRWLPVIWYKKWWLIPFIENDLNLENYQWLCTDEKLFNCVSILLEEPIKKRKPIVDIKNYSKENWIIKLLPIIWKHKKILLISDFINKVWGIETYIHDVKELLDNHWYEVKIRWWYLPRWRIWKFKKLFGIWWWSFNFLNAILLLIFWLRRKPDLIWYHSTLRRLGWMSVLVWKFIGKERWMMYHDLWYFFPFPKKLLYEQQIKTPLTLFSFISMTKDVFPKMILLAIWKYLSLSLLKAHLRWVNKHLVPSWFLVDILHKSHKIPKKKIFCLEHFLQE